MAFVKFFGVLIATMILWAGPIFAQDSDAATQFSARLDQQRQSLQVVTDTLDTEATTPVAFDSLRDVLRERRADLQDLISDITPFLEEAQAQLDGLGPVPATEAEGAAPEPENIQALRQNLEDRARQFDGLRTEATLLETNTTRLLDRIAELRRQDFISGLFEPVEGFNADKFWPNVQAALAGLSGRVFGAINAFSAHIRGMAVATFLLFAALAGLSIARSKRRMDNTPPPTRREALGRVADSLRGPVGIFALFAVLALIFARFVVGDLPQADSLFVLCISVIGLLLFAYLLLRRLALVGQIGLVSYLILFAMIAIFAIDGLVLEAGQVYGALLELVVAQSYLSTGLIAVLALILAAKQYVASNFKLLDGHGHPMITLLFAGFGFVILGLNLLGYPALARFGVRIVLLSAFLVAFVYVIRDWGRSVISQTLRPQEPQNALSSEEETPNNFTFYWRAFLLDTALLFLAIPIFARIIGLSWSDIQDWSYQAFFGFQIGAVNISIVAVFFGVCLFFALILITRLVQRVLGNRVLTKTRLTQSVRQSIVQIFGYIGLAIALLVGVASMGFDLSNIALIAGALSVGIGFGLQSIVSNFVSGLILLFERPIKVGDWVATSTGEGMVRKISVRATEIETFDKNYVIVPNAELISNTVKNWTHHNNLGRLKITIGASYDADPHKVKEVLESVAEKSDAILSIPQPSVFFRDFGDNALIFDLRVFVRDILYGFQVETQLRLDIWDAFKEAGIEISYPQRDIHIRSAPPELTARAGEMDEV
ncbi:MAG: mechanosensitive ion channel domain-containing protein [Pseudomonadota bacterium]